jgi:hypothetical protein
MRSPGWPTAIRCERSVGTGPSDRNNFCPGASGELAGVETAADAIAAVAIKGGSALRRPAGSERRTLDWFATDSPETLFHLCQEVLGVLADLCYLRHRV